MKDVGRDTIKNRASIIRSFFPGTGHSYDRVVHLFTLGLDYYWKRVLLQHLPKDSRRVLDLACGTGIVTEGISKRCPQVVIVGVDITDDYLKIYEDRIRAKNIRASFLLGNAEDVKLEGAFDAVVSSYIPKYVDPEILLSNIAPHLKSSGILAVHDFYYPPNPLARSIWWMYNRVMNFIGMLFFPEWHEVFDGGLTSLIKNTDWFEKWKQTLHQFGYEIKAAHTLSFGSSAIIVAQKK